MGWGGVGQLHGMGQVEVEVNARLTTAAALLDRHSLPALHMPR